MKTLEIEAEVLNRWARKFVKCHCKGCPVILEVAKGSIRDWYCSCCYVRQYACRDRHTQLFDEPIEWRPLRHEPSVGVGGARKVALRRKQYQEYLDFDPGE